MSFRVAYEEGNGGDRCRVPGCSKQRAFQRTICSMHKLRKQRTGTYDLRPSRATTPPLERFWSKVDQSGDCWQWTAYTSRDGYGHFNISRRDGLVRAHRFAYEQLVGPIPDGLDLDHLCRNRGCVNPAHLEPVTRRVNIIRGRGMGARNAAKTHCANGHEFSVENTRWRGNHRTCLTCEKARNLRKQAKRRAQNAA